MTDHVLVINCGSSSLKFAAIDPRTGVAALTGLGAWVAGYPFLTSTVWHLSLPLLGEVHVASAMFFDTGVFLVVVGATMLALANLSRIARRAEFLPVNVEPMDIDPSLQSHSGQG